MRVLVTGAAGFVGIPLVRAVALRPGVTAVLATDLAPAPDPATLQPRGDAQAPIAYRIVDVRDRAAVRTVVDDFRPEAVIHAAAVTPGPDGDAQEARRVARVNTEGAFTVLDVAGASGRVRRVIALSSAAVFGGPVSRQALPEETPPDPRSLYGASKLALENIALRLGRRHRVPTTVVRLAAVYGAMERATESRPLTSLVHRLTTGTAPIRVAGDDIVRDWIAADDAAAALAALLAAPETPRCLYHLGGGEAVGWWRLVAAVAAAGRRVERCDEAGAADLVALPSDARPVLAIDRLRAAIGFRPRSIEDGIRALMSHADPGGPP